MTLRSRYTPKAERNMWSNEPTAGKRTCRDAPYCRPLSLCVAAAEEVERGRGGGEEGEENSDRKKWPSFKSATTLITGTPSRSNPPGSNAFTTIHT